MNEKILTAHWHGDIYDFILYMFLDSVHDSNPPNSTETSNEAKIYYYDFCYNIYLLDMAIKNCMILFPNLLEISMARNILLNRMVDKQGGSISSDRCNEYSGITNSDLDYYFIHLGVTEAGTKMQKSRHDYDIIIRKCNDVVNKFLSNKIENDKKNYTEQYEQRKQDLENEVEDDDNDYVECETLDELEQAYKNDMNKIIQPNDYFKDGKLVKQKNKSTTVETNSDFVKKWFQFYGDGAFSCYTLYKLLDEKNFNNDFTPLLAIIGEVLSVKNITLKQVKSFLIGHSIFYTNKYDPIFTKLYNFKVNYILPFVNAWEQEPVDGKFYTFNLFDNLPERPETNLINTIANLYDGTCINDKKIYILPNVYFTKDELLVKIRDYKFVLKIGDHDSTKMHFAMSTTSEKSTIAIANDNYVMRPGLSFYATCLYINDKIYKYNPINKKNFGELRNNFLKPDQLLAKFTKDFMQLIVAAQFNCRFFTRDKILRAVAKKFFKIQTD